MRSKMWLEQNAISLFRMALSAALLLLPSMVFPQSRVGDVVVNIPFAFVAGESTLPPGHYTVTHLNDNLTIHDRGNRGVYVSTHSAQRSAEDNTTKLVFHRYGNAYFLSEVWVAGDLVGRALVPSRAERELTGSGRRSEVAVLHLAH